MHSITMCPFYIVFKRSTLQNDYDNLLEVLLASKLKGKDNDT